MSDQLRRTTHSVLLIASALLLLLLPVESAFNLFDSLKTSNIDYDYGGRNNDSANQRRQLEMRRKLLEMRNDEHVEVPRHSRRSLEEQTISSGLFHTCALTHRAGVDEESCGEHACGPAKCWGNNDRGQASPPPGVMFQQVSSGGFFTCGLKAGGRVVCWGDIDHPPRSLESLSGKELSDFKHARRMQQEREGWTGPSSRPVNGGDYYTQVSSGMKHACALSRDSEIHCWGRNDYGESSPPTGSFVQVSAGHTFTCGIRPNGEMECWGKNNMGQTMSPSYPKNIFQQVSASVGGDHACGVLMDGEGVRCWGDNGRGQSDDQDGT
ncbi:hypothetical protein ACHAWF_016496 [Thalassiosira exigua]